MNKYLLLLGLSVMLIDIRFVSGQVEKSIQSQQSIDDFIENKMKQAGIVGMGASIITDGKVIWSKGYGLADKENHIPFSPSTRRLSISFRHFSCSPGLLDECRAA